MINGLPKTVRIGPHDIKFGTLTRAEAARDYGLWVPAEQTIKLNEEYVSGSMAADTVLHEVLHAIFSVGTVQVKLGEEHVVSVVATYLTQVIRDNPEMIEWMQETVRK